MSKGRLLLINPWIYDFAAFNLWVEPIGLLSIGSIFRQHGYQLDFIDCLDRYNPDLLKLQGTDRTQGQTPTAQANITENRLNAQRLSKMYRAISAGTVSRQRFLNPNWINVRSRMWCW